jgi:excisionase family DNA binding protein
MQVSIALLIGLWGIKELLSPSELPVPIRYGSEQIILFNYFFLGISIFLWFFDRWATSRGWRWFQLPYDENGSKVSFGGDIYDSTVIVPQNGARVQVVSHNLSKENNRNISWTTKEVANYLGINPNEVTALARTGKIIGIKDGGRWRYNKEDITKWQMNQT